jgi:archaellum biogenesis protein FlaJ (TadC family)
MTKWQKNAAYTLALYALVVVMFRISSGAGWGMALLIALVVTPLALWMGWLRRRMNEQAQEWGRRRARPWPEERRR